LGHLSERSRALRRVSGPFVFVQKKVRGGRL
jgi:hypothetical protein